MEVSLEKHYVVNGEVAHSVEQNGNVFMAGADFPTHNVDKVRLDQLISGRYIVEKKDVVVEHKPVDVKPKENE